jgi:GMP synthase (glutamine-hydrolysing)
MTAPRILILDGNTAAVRAKLQAAVGYDSGQGYARMLQRLVPSAACEILRAADGPVAFPGGTALNDYDGCVMTGSALNVYEGGPAIDRQIQLVSAVLTVGLPFFGSCWGLQVAAVAAGGRVEANPLGREFGYGRRIALTAEGRNHPMFIGKPAVFEAPTIHRDVVTALPPGASVLASNEMGLQAASFDHGQGTVWGVQYHPEYDHLDIAAVSRRYAAALLTDGTFADAAALERYATDLEQLQRDPTNRALVSQYGLGPAMTDETLRRLEISNWIEQMVLPRARRHA